MVFEKHLYYATQKNVYKSLAELADKGCGKPIGGRNTRDIKWHLQSFHKTNSLRKRGVALLIVVVSHWTLKLEIWQGFDAKLIF